MHESNGYPNTRDLQLLITDGESFCHEERRDLLHQTEYPEQNALFYRLTNSDRDGRYRLVKEIVVDPHSSVLLRMPDTIDGSLRRPALVRTGTIGAASRYGITRHVATINLWTR